MGCPARKAFADAQSQTIRKRHVHFGKPLGVRLDEQNFPPLCNPSTSYQASPTKATLQQNLSWTEILQDKKTEQSSVVTVLVKTMKTMIVKMSQLIEVLASQVAK